MALANRPNAPRPAPASPRDAVSGRRIVIVTGPPGAGKTTIARALAEGAVDPGGVHIPGDDFLGYIRTGFIPPHLVISRHQNLTLSRAVAAAAVSYAAGGYFVALDWVVGPWFLDIYRSEARGAGVPLDYVVLRPSLDAVIARCRSRDVHPIADYSHLRPLYERLGCLGDLEGHVLDTSTLSPDETLAVVRGGLGEGRFRLG